MDLNFTQLYIVLKTTGCVDMGILILVYMHDFLHVQYFVKKNSIKTLHAHIHNVEI